jgi:hypothetical protein
MDNKGKPKTPTISDERNILVQVEAHIETYIEEASWLRLSVPLL